MLGLLCHKATMSHRDLDYNISQILTSSVACCTKLVSVTIPYKDQDSRIFFHKILNKSKPYCVLMFYFECLAFVCGSNYAQFCFTEFVKQTNFPVKQVFFYRKYFIVILG